MTQEDAGFYGGKEMPLREHLYSELKHYKYFQRKSDVLFDAMIRQVITLAQSQEWGDVNVKYSLCFR